MKASGALAISVITGLAYSSFLDGLVYIFDNALQQAPATEVRPLIQPQIARLLFAQRLGLSQYHSLEEPQETTLDFFNRYGETYEHLFEEARSGKERQRLLVIVEGVEKPEDFFGQARTPSFAIAKPPASSSNHQLIKDFFSQDVHHRGSNAHCVGDSSKEFAAETITGGLSGNDPFGTCLVHTPISNPSTPTGRVEELNIMSLPALRKVFGSNMAGATALFHVKTLETIAQQDGTSSETYKRAEELLKTLLSDLLHQSKTQVGIVVIMPMAPGRSNSDADGYGFYDVPQNLAKDRRQAEAPMPLGTPVDISSLPNGHDQSNRPMALNSSTRRKPILPACHSTQKLCNTATNNCSGRGICHHKYKPRSDNEIDVSCWACACDQTTVRNKDGTSKSPVWGGAACQKEDVSAPFFLIAGFTVTIVAALAWGIGLLYSIGQDDLPSVIGAGVSGPRAQK